MPVIYEPSDSIMSVTSLTRCIACHGDLHWLCLQDDVCFQFAWWLGRTWCVVFVDAWVGLEGTG